MTRKYPLILSATRTPSGGFQGSLSSLTAPQLGAVVVKEAVRRAGIPDPADIHEVIMGNVVAAGLVGRRHPGASGRAYKELHRLENQSCVRVRGGRMKKHWICRYFKHKMEDILIKVNGMAGNVRVTSAKACKRCNYVIITYEVEFE